MPDGASRQEDRAGDARRSFSALDWKERARLINEAEARQTRYFNQIMPLARSALLPPEIDIQTVGEAQRALLLESYYTLLEVTLKGQELFLDPWTTTKDPQERERAAGELRRRADEEHTRLQAVQQRGDWRPLKEKWLRWIPAGERLPESGRSDGDWVRASYRAMKEAFGRGAMSYDYQRTQRILALVPDQTPPVRASSLDTDPPLL